MGVCISGITIDPVLFDKMALSAGGVEKRRSVGDLYLDLTPVAVVRLSMQTSRSSLRQSRTGLEIVISKVVGP